MRVTIEQAQGEMNVIIDDEMVMRTPLAGTALNYAWHRLAGFSHESWVNRVQATA